MDGWMDGPRVGPRVGWSESVIAMPFVQMCCAEVHKSLVRQHGVWRQHGAMRPCVAVPLGLGVRRMWILWILW